MTRLPRRLAALVLAAFAGAVPVVGPLGSAGAVERGALSVSDSGYIVVLKGEMTDAGFAASVSEASVLAAVATAGGTVTQDLSKQVGVLFVRADAPAFADALTATGLVEVVGKDFGVKVFGDSPEEPSAPQPDPLESLQWDMDQINVYEAHEVQSGRPEVDVGILDTGIDGLHPDFLDPVTGSNVACDRGRNSISFLPAGPGVGNPDPCVDNQFHGTHVAGTVAARRNEIGVIGVAPNVTLVPVKVCDSSGFCYASAAVDGITYAGDEELDVINMSFFVDDDEFQESTEFKCMDDPTQRGFRLAVERALHYARSQGVTPVAALGNSDVDLAHPEDSDPSLDGKKCDVVPAETKGVVGTAALGPDSEKARYSNWGNGATDVAAPGGNGTTGDCTTTVLSTAPGGTYVCVQGTSMASPHATGVAALIVSEFGSLGSDGDVKMSPFKVEDYLESSAVDIGIKGYDECFGNGRIDARRAVTHTTKRLYDATAPFCPEYEE